MTKPSAAGKNDQAEVVQPSVATSPQQVSEVIGRELCPALQQLFAAYRPQTEFQRMLLVIHCLMVESGFSAMNREEVTALARHPWAGYALPSGVAGQLSSASVTSVSIMYALREGVPGYALLKVVNTGRLAVCHCAVGGGSEMAERSEVVASEHFNIGRHIGHDPAGHVCFSGLRRLAVQFKDCIAQRAKTAMHEANGLAPPGLSGLPTELLLKVMRHCHFTSVCRLGQASRRLSRLCADNFVWRQQLRLHYASSDYYQQATTAEQLGEAVSYYEAFRAAHSERMQRMRMIARRGSREISLLPPLDFRPSPFGHLRSGGTGRLSLDQFLLPDTFWDFDGDPLPRPDLTSRRRAPF